MLLAEDHIGKIKFHICLFKEIALICFDHRIIE